MDAQGLEQDAEEPGKEDVAWNEPSQLPPVLLAVADAHLRRREQTLPETKI